MDVAIHSSLTSFAEPVIIEARIEIHPDSSVPIERVLLKREGQIPLLLL